MWTSDESKWGLFLVLPFYVIAYNMIQWCRNIANGGFQNGWSHIGDAHYSSVKDNGEYEPKPMAPISGFYTGKNKMSNLLLFVLLLQ